MQKNKLLILFLINLILIVGVTAKVSTIFETEVSFEIGESDISSQYYFFDDYDEDICESVGEEDWIEMEGEIEINEKLYPLQKSTVCLKVCNNRDTDIDEYMISVTQPDFDYISLDIFGMDEIPSGGCDISGIKMSVGSYAEAGEFSFNIEAETT